MARIAGDGVARRGWAMPDDLGMIREFELGYGER